MLTPRLRVDNMDHICGLALGPTQYQPACGCTLHKCAAVRRCQRRARKIEFETMFTTPAPRAESVTHLPVHMEACAGCRVCRTASSTGQVSPTPPAGDAGALGAASAHGDGAVQPAARWKKKSLSAVASQKLHICGPTIREAGALGAAATRGDIAAQPAGRHIEMCPSKFEATDTPEPVTLRSTIPVVLRQEKLVHFGQLPRAVTV